MMLASICNSCGEFKKGKCMKGIRKGNERINDCSEYTNIIDRYY